MKFALRQLLKNPGFTAVAVLTLALGLGSATTIFGVIHTLCFRTLPYPDAGQLVRVYRTSPQSQGWPHSAASFLDQRERVDAFSHLAAYSGWSFNLSEPGQPAEQTFALRTASDFFPMLGVPPLIGRYYTEAEDQPGQNDVIVLSHPFWQRRFHGDPNIIGKTIGLDGDSAEIIGVMPASFGEPWLWGNVDLWKALGFTAEQRAQRGNNWLASGWMRQAIPESSRPGFMIFGVAVAVILLTSWLASWLPARRAAQVDPMEALRHE